MGLLVLLAGPVVASQVVWALVIVRVAGSGIAAMGLCMRGWTMRTGSG